MAVFTNKTNARDLYNLSHIYSDDIVSLNEITTNNLEEQILKELILDDKINYVHQISDYKGITVKSKDELDTLLFSKKNNNYDYILIKADYIETEYLKDLLYTIHEYLEGKAIVDTDNINLKLSCIECEVTTTDISTTNYFSNFDEYNYKYAKAGCLYEIRYILTKIIFNNKNKYKSLYNNITHSNPLKIINSFYKLPKVNDNIVKSLLNSVEFEHFTGENICKVLTLPDCIYCKDIIDLYNNLLELCIDRHYKDEQFNTDLVKFVSDEIIYILLQVINTNVFYTTKTLFNTYEKFNIDIRYIINLPRLTLDNNGFNWLIKFAKEISHIQESNHIPEEQLIDKINLFSEKILKEMNIEIPNNINDFPDTNYYDLYQYKSEDEYLIIKLNKLISNIILTRKTDYTKELFLTNLLSALVLIDEKRKKDLSNLFLSIREYVSKEFQ